MKITIADQHKPFSHTPGTAFILPGSHLSVHVYPALLRVYDLSLTVPKLLTEITVEVNGPVKGFTAQQDLEKGCLKVWGESLLGYFRYTLHANLDNPQAVAIHIERRAHPLAFGCSHGYSLIAFSENKLLATPFQTSKNATIYQSSCLEKLSLGNNKAQDWSLIQRRCDLTEIFPLWLHLGQQTPVLPPSGSSTPSLWQNCSDAVTEHKLAILPTFTDLFLAGFDQGLSPRLNDTQFQGFGLPISSFTSPIELLTEGARLIRRQFIREEQDHIYILPALSPEFHSGRFINIQCLTGRCDIEWSKKEIRRMIFFTEQIKQVSFHFSKGINRFRLRENLADKGRIVERDMPLDLCAGKKYYFDNFE